MLTAIHSLYRALYCRREWFERFDEESGGGGGGEEGGGGGRVERDDADDDSHNTSSPPGTGSTPSPVESIRELLF